MFWFLEKSVWARLEAAYKSGLTTTAEQQTKIDARNSGALPDILSMGGSEATISVSGVLTKHFDLWAWYFFGNTTYTDIITSLAVANADPKIEKINMVFDSPGGNTSGLFEAMDAVKASKKPVTAFVDDMAASAAFGLATQATTVLASGRAAVVGSVGVAASFRVNDDIVDITSTEAPDKRPDLTTEEGKAVVRKQLDDIHQLFAEAIADGRGTTVAKVNKDFGRGAVVLAADAQKRGMIDGLIQSASSSIVAINNTSPVEPEDNNRSAKMDLETLKAQHPGLYAELIALGVTAGVKQERERCSAHIIMAETTGANKIAMDAIKGGSDLGPELQAKYLSAAINKQSTDARVADGGEADPGTPATPSASTSGDDMQNSVADGVLKLMGTEQA